MSAELAHQKADKHLCVTHHRKVRIRLHPSKEPVCGIAKKIKVGHIMSVPPHIFAPRNLKWSDKDMKQVKYDKVYEITDSLQRV